jgi:hypothetical protein
MTDSRRALVCVLWCEGEEAEWSAMLGVSVF